MAAVLEVSPSTVMRDWQANGLKPHLVSVCIGESNCELPGY